MSGSQPANHGYQQRGAVFLDMKSQAMIEMDEAPIYVEYTRNPHPLITSSASHFVSGLALIIVCGSLL